MPLTDAETRLVGWGALWAATDLALGNTIDPLYKVPATFLGIQPTTPDALAQYITPGLRNYLRVNESVAIADAAFNAAQKTLIENHQKAAAVILDAPTPNALLALNEALTDVSEALKQAQIFRASANLAGALAKIITDSAAPAPAGGPAPVGMMAMALKTKSLADTMATPADVATARTLEAMARAVEAMAGAVEAMGAARPANPDPPEAEGGKKPSPKRPKRS